MIVFFVLLMAMIYAVYYFLEKELLAIQTQISSLKKAEMTFEEAKEIVESEGYSLSKKQI